MSANTTLLEGGISVTSQEVQENTLDNNVGAYFDIIQEHSITIQNQITDNYLENNTAVQDHIAQSPLIVSLRGISGEIVFRPPTQTRDKINEQFKKYSDKIPNFISVDKLKELPVILPPVSNMTQLARNATQYIETSVNRYMKIYKSFGEDKLNRETQLQKVFNRFLRLRAANIPLRVETPYKLEPLDNMYIQSLTLRQGNENFVTDIELTLKQIQYADVKTTEVDTNVMAKYNALARAKEENNGKTQGTQSLLKVMSDKFGVTSYGSGIKR